MSKLWIRVWWWLLLCTYTAPLTQPRSSSISPICIPHPCISRRRSGSSESLEKRHGVCPLCMSTWVHYTGIRAGGLSCVLQRRACTNVIVHCNEDWGNMKEDIFQLILLHSLSQEKELGPQFTTLSLVLNGMAQHKREYNTMLSMFRVILCRNFLLYFLLEISVSPYI